MCQYLSPPPRASAAVCVQQHPPTDPRRSLSVEADFSPADNVKHKQRRIKQGASTDTSKLPAAPQKSSFRRFDAPFYFRPRRFWLLFFFFFRLFGFFFFDHSSQTPDRTSPVDSRKVGGMLRVTGWGMRFVHGENNMFCTLTRMMQPGASPFLVSRD